MQTGLTTARLLMTDMPHDDASLTAYAEVSALIR